MRAVNLLPEKHRPRKASGGGQGSSYILIGGLGALLACVLLYVLTLNSINTSKGEIAEAKAETQRAEAQTQSLGAYGDFAKVKEQRVASVKQLADGRFDWERMVRELAHVLPEDVWLTSASAAEAGAEAAGGASGAPSPSDPAAAAAGPTLTLQGCARDQSQVAVTLVRLKELRGAEDAELDHSTRGTEAEAGAGNASSSPTDCGSTNGEPNYAFQASVTFAPTIDPDTAAVPRRLGGGA